MLWSKQLFYYDVARWLDGDPTQPTPPDARKHGRNSRWRNFDGFDIISMPDKWEYPWFAAWDLAFHTVPLAHLDPAFAKYQLILICREWFQHPQGALPAYEWDFGDVNPPVHAWAALRCSASTAPATSTSCPGCSTSCWSTSPGGSTARIPTGTTCSRAASSGLDNIGPIDRSHLPVGYTLEQSDATGWMGAYALATGSLAAALQRSGNRKAQDLVLKFLEHFAGIRKPSTSQGLWDDTDGLFYDRLVTPSVQRPGQDPLRGRHHPGAGRHGHRPRHAANAVTMDKNFTEFLRRRASGTIGEAGRAPAAAR